MTSYLFKKIHSILNYNFLTTFSRKSCHFVANSKFDFPILLIVSDAESSVLLGNIGIWSSPFFFRINPLELVQLILHDQ